jgi:phosphoglycerate kinase
VVTQSAKNTRTIAPDKVEDDETIMDAGPETGGLLQKLILKAEFILWNGPLGNYELGFTKGTEDLARTIAQSKREAIVGGGDTLAAIAKLNLFKKISFVSTGGGATLDFLANETLPGIEALK